MRDRVLAAVRACAGTMAVVLPAFWSMTQLRAWWAVPVDAIVFAVMLAFAVPRGLARVGPAELPAAAAALGAGAAAATGCGMLLGFDDWRRVLGAAAFTVRRSLSTAAESPGRKASHAEPPPAEPIADLVAHAHAIAGLGLAPARRGER